jgi:hypothetical protein
VRLRELVEREVSGCKISALRDGDLLVLLPETEAASASALAARLGRSSAGELGLALRVGVASFPGDELTLNGLIERARLGCRHPSAQVNGAPRDAIWRDEGRPGPERLAPAA